MQMQLFAEAVDQGLTGAVPMDESLAAYARRRDELTANGFELTLSTARLAALSPRMEGFYREAAEQPDTISRIFGVLGGSIPMRELVSR